MVVGGDSETRQFAAMGQASGSKHRRNQKHERQQVRTDTLTFVNAAQKTKPAALVDIEAYENEHPEVLEAFGGINKQRGYFLCLTRNKPKVLDNVLPFPNNNQRATK